MQPILQVASTREEDMDDAQEAETYPLPTPPSTGGNDRIDLDADLDAPQGAALDPLL